MIIPVISTVCGALFGGLQNHLEHKQDSKKEIEIARINAEKEVAMASHNTVISQNQLQTQESSTVQEQSKTEASVRQSEASEYGDFSRAIVETSKPLEGSSRLANISNFITTTLRPFITYSLFGLVIYSTVKILNGEAINENHLAVFELVLAEFSAAMSYWFVRRSFEKRNSPQFITSKKKLI